jgi:hypothetical protein
MFDRICRDGGIWHLLTKPYSITTGKVERLHKTMRAEFSAAGRQYATLAELQAALDALVEDSILPGRTSPTGSPADRAVPVSLTLDHPRRSGCGARHPRQRRLLAPGRPPPGGVSRSVNAYGTISLAGFSHAVGAAYVAGAAQRLGPRPR